MPELPEIQALAERIDAAIGRGTLASVTALQFSALKTFRPPPDELIGRPVTRVTNRAKYVIIETDGPRVLIHLSQGGRVDIEDPAKTTRPKGAVVRFTVADGPSVLIKEFGTERKAGWWILAVGDDGPLTVLGPDPFTDEFAQLVRTSTDTRRVHTWLRDQRTVSGIGRGYSDDILHAARLSPYATIAQLGADERENLIVTIRSVLTEGLTAERQRTGGLPPKVGDHFAVHARHGQPCPRCGDDLRRVSYEAYEVTYCPACQTGGKVLADRRLSRLVR
jgi:formamidopyrimidine-DNA glycosylase